MENNTKKAWNIKNISEEKLIDPETGVVIGPGECKRFTDEYAFLRFTSIFNGSWKIVDDKEFYRWAGSLSLKKDNNQENQQTEEVVTPQLESVEDEQVSDSEENKPTPQKGRPKKK